MSRSERAVRLIRGAVLATLAMATLATATLAGCGDRGGVPLAHQAPAPGGDARRPAPASPRRGPASPAAGRPDALAPAASAGDTAADTAAADTAAGDTAGARRAIESTVRRYVRATHDGDVAALAQLYADDALMLPPSRPPVLGRAAIARFWHDGLEPGFELVTLRIAVHGDLAYVVGRYTVPETDDAPADTGSSVLTLRRQHDGTWRLTTDIWNTSTGDDAADVPEEPEETPPGAPVA